VPLRWGRSVRGLFFCRPVARVVLLRGVEKTSDQKKKQGHRKSGSQMGFGGRPRALFSREFHAPKSVWRKLVMGVLIEVRPSEAPTTAEAHLLPCEIQHTGPAAVTAYFRPVTGKRNREVAFRGRHLHGVVLSPPEGYKGAMLQDTVQADVADGEERRWMHRGDISSITIWKHDEPPAEDAAVFKCMRWAAIADVLHASEEQSGDEAE
jgi:ribonuclease H2 subunit C